QYMTDPTDDHKQLYKEVQNYLNTFVTNYAQSKLDFEQQHFFRMGGRSGKLLAHMANPRSNLKPISAIPSPDGTTCT
ncbi:Hypothetical predicted protein, partial [Pelobates cultripes]